jgi:nucleotide-binding universal stress UspA family protein
MTILIGLAQGQTDDGAVHLGGMLARSSRDDLVVASVVQAPWPPTPHRADQEYLAHQQEMAHVALARARQLLGGIASDAEFVVSRAASAPAGLLQVVAERRCSSVVVGSSTMGLMGHVMLGGVAERLLHSAGLPILVAPRGFHVGPTATVSQVSVAFGRDDHDGRLIGRTAPVARTLGARLRVVCFAVRPMAAVADTVEPGVEQRVVAEWMQRLGHDIERALAAGLAHDAVAGDGPVATRVETVLGLGGSWPAALHDVDWSDGDLLTVGISSGPWGRLFLGSHAAKIVRSSPVPIMLLSRG